jgi:hypothetical protein
MRSEDWKNTLDAMEQELVADGLFFPGDVPPPPGVLRQPTRQEAEVAAVKMLFISEGRVALEALKSLPEMDQLNEESLKAVEQRYHGRLQDIARKYPSPGHKAHLPIYCYGYGQTAVCAWCSSPTDAGVNILILPLESQPLCPTCAAAFDKAFRQKPGWVRFLSNAQCWLLRLFVHTDAATLERRRQTHEHGIAWRPKQIDNEG